MKEKKRPWWENLKLFGQNHDLYILFRLCVDCSSFRQTSQTRLNVDNIICLKPKWILIIYPSRKPRLEMLYHVSVSESQ